ncbi:glycosyltransferase family 2 protein [Aestuariivivens sediminicola]|uniref:glycosyltransferase family 2 protein n=1 Tax=Aestuariivivens sediminicola TaxID=2913560 RepID=UPI001F5941C9|nr:glycosyltransferase family 2 protein [Aestuariivivens sediminicola]
MSLPLISILTPFKNTESFITECIDSIRNQTYSNWELVIVDDGSTDRSYDLVESYQKRDPRIQLLKNSGTGIIDALQLALEQASGTFITRMDSDDIMAPNKLEVLANNLMSHGKKHVAIGLVRYFCADGVGEGYRHYESWLNDLTKLGTNYTEIYKECVIPSPCWMIHKDDLMACGAFHPRRYPEDYDLTFRFYKHQFKCIPCDHVLHYWRDYPTRTSRTHVHYEHNHFTALKTHHFIAIDYNPDKKLVVWGAGSKGKKTAKILLEHGIAFEWICNNPNKISRSIYGKVLLPFGHLRSWRNTQSIITVANKKAQKEIRHYLGTLNLRPVRDYVFFC